MSLLVFFIFIILVYLLCYIPGRLIAQLLPLDFKVKFAISFGISYFIYYLLGFSQYVFNVPFVWEYMFLAVIIIPVCIYLYKNNNLKISATEIKLLLIFFLGYLFLSIIQSLKPYYSGGASYWDWYEYYYRSTFFFNHLPPFSPIGNTLLPQRLPLYHAATSFFMSFFGSGYWVIQPVNSLFNMSALLPLFLICADFFLPKMKPVTIFIFVMSLVLLNFHFVAMSIYPWTKAMTAYYVVLGIYFCLMSHRYSNKSLFIYLGMIFLAMGHLVHQVSFSYILGTAVVFFILSLRNRQFFHFLLSVFLHVLILLTWYYWAFATYGFAMTFNSAPIAVNTNSIPLVEKFNILVYNFVFTVLPFNNQYLWDITYSNKSFFILLFDRAWISYGGTFPSAISYTVTLAILIFSSFVLFHLLRKKKIRIRIYFGRLILLLFFFSGILNLLVGEKGGNDAGLMLFPSTLVLLSLGVYAIISSAKKFGKIFIYLFTLLLAIESIIGVWSYALVPKFFLDPVTNKNIDMQKDLYDLWDYSRYFGFAVHLQNYTLKLNNNLILLYDKFADLQSLFVGGFVLGWLGLVGSLVYSLNLLVKEDKA